MLGRAFVFRKKFYESETGEVLPAKRFRRERGGWLDSKTGEFVVGRGSRIDDSHHAFKRTGKIGPGPAGRVIEQAKKWRCEKGKNTKDYYFQKC